MKPRTVVNLDAGANDLRDALDALLVLLDDPRDVGAREAFHTSCATLIAADRTRVVQLARKARRRGDA